MKHKNEDEIMLIPKHGKDKNNDSICEVSKHEMTEVSIVINKDTTQFDLYKGIVFMLLSCLVRSSYSIVNKLLLDRNKLLSPFQLLTFRTYLMVWISGLSLPFYYDKVFTKENKQKNMNLVFLRSFLSLFSAGLMVYSIKHIDIADVFTIFYIYPAFIIILSFVFLREKVGALDYLCLVSCLIGALLIIKPSFLFPKDFTSKNKDNASVFYLCVILAALLKSIEDLCVRGAGEDFHPLIFPLMYILFGIVFFPLPVIINREEITKIDYVDFGYFVFLAFSNILQAVFLVLGLQYENAGRVSMINYLQLAFIYIFDVLILHKEITMMDFTGTFLIFGINFCNGVYKAMKRDQKLKRYNKDY